MKKVIFSILFIIAFMVPAAQGAIFEVTSNPLWTSTEIYLCPECSYEIEYERGTWTWQNGQGPFDAGGDPNTSAYDYDEFLTSANHAELIGFIGSDPFAVAQNNSGFFRIGMNEVVLTGKSGLLWLGFNDDYASGAIGDNSGSVYVEVEKECVPEPVTLLLFGLGILGVAGVRRYM